MLSMNTIYIIKQTVNLQKVYNYWVTSIWWSIFLRNNDVGVWLFHLRFFTTSKTSLSKRKIFKSNWVQLQLIYRFYQHRILQIIYKTRRQRGHKRAKIVWKQMLTLTVMSPRSPCCYFSCTIFIATINNIQGFTFEIRDICPATW